MSNIHEPSPPDSGLMAGYMSEQQVAEARGKERRTLRAERARGEGPPYLRDGRCVFYPVDGFRVWLKSLEVSPVRSRQAG